MDKQAALNNPLSWILGGALATSWLFGAVHAWQAHSGWQALAAVLLPPYGLYMAVEQDIGHPPERAQGDNSAGLFRSGERRCRDDPDMFKKSGLSRDQYDVWCSCSWQMISERFTSEEADYVRENQRNSPQFQKVMRQARGSCYSSARYLGSSEVPLVEAP